MRFGCFDAIFWCIMASFWLLCGANGSPAWLHTKRCRHHGVRISCQRLCWTVFSGRVICEPAARHQKGVFARRVAHNCNAAAIVLYPVCFVIRPVVYLSGLYAAADGLHSGCMDAESAERKHEVVCACAGRRKHRLRSGSTRDGQTCCPVWIRDHAPYVLLPSR